MAGKKIAAGTSESNSLTFGDPQTAVAGSRGQNLFRCLELFRYILCTK